MRGMRFLSSRRFHWLFSLATKSSKILWKFVIPGALRLRSYTPMSHPLLARLPLALGAATYGLSRLPRLRSNPLTLSIAYNLHLSATYTSLQPAPLILFPPNARN